MKEFLHACNTPDGRWNRQKIWLYPLGLSLLLFIPIGIISAIIPELWAILAIVAYLYLLYVSVVATVKRLRDLDKNPWMTLLMFVPIANIYLAIICYFFKGTTGPNKYGPDPLAGENTPTEKQETVEL